MIHRTLDEHSRHELQVATEAKRAHMLSTGQPQSPRKVLQDDSPGARGGPGLMSGSPGGGRTQFGFGGPGIGLCRCVKEGRACPQGVQCRFLHALNSQTDLQRAQAVRRKEREVMSRTTSAPAVASLDRRQQPVGA